MTDMKEAIDLLGAEEAAALYYDWSLWARPSQRPPKGQWRVWLLMAGRGFGKTRTGAEWIRSLAQQHAGCEIGLVGASFDDARHVMVDGPSGILHISAPDERPIYLSSRHQLLWPNGTRARLFAADKPSQLRGPEFHFAWADEIAKWRYPEAWDQLMMGLRRGANPAVIATTTPQPLPWLLALSKAPDTVLVQGRTIENEANLSPGFMAAMTQSYGGTLWARQELEGELLCEVPDALFRRQDIEHYRAIPPKRDGFIRVVIGVDPAIGGANETGIIVAGKTADHHIWVLGDYSLHAQPHIWASRVREAFTSWRADCVIVEVNQGGDLVEHLLRHNGCPLPIRKVRAFHNKATRSEPVAAAYARGEILHGADLQELTEQMVTFTAHHKGPSPDRFDAAIWAITALLSGTQTTSHELSL